MEGIHSLRQEIEVKYEGTKSTIKGIVEAHLPVSAITLYTYSITYQKP